MLDVFDVFGLPNAFNLLDVFVMLGRIGCGSRAECCVCVCVCVCVWMLRVDLRIGIGLRIRIRISNEVRLQLRCSFRLRIAGLFDLVGDLRHLEGLHRLDGVFG